MRVSLRFIFLISTFSLVACNGDTAISPENGHTPPEPVITAPEAENPVDTPTQTDPETQTPTEPTQPIGIALPVTLEANQVIMFYNRADEQYDGWGLHLWNTPECNVLSDASLAGVTWPTPFLPTGFDEQRGAYFVLDIKQSVGCFNFIMHKGDEKSLSQNDLTYDLSQGVVLITDHDTQEITYPLDPSTSLPFTLQDNQAALIYKRDDNAYEGWGLHLWKDTNCSALADSALEGVVWESPKLPTAIDSTLGAYFILDLSEPQGCINYIIHKGDERGQGEGDFSLDLTLGNVLFTQHGSSEVRYSGTQAEPLVTLTNASAHMVDASTLIWNPPENTQIVEIRSSLTGDIVVDNGEAQNGTTITTTQGTISTAAAEKFPHISAWPAYTVVANDEAVKAALKGQLVALAYDANNNLLSATRIQTAGALDALFATDTVLGAVISDAATQFNVWAPTAQNMQLYLFDSMLNSVEGYPVVMQENNGVWSTTVDTSIEGYFYQYEVTVYHYATGQIETTRTTDPYSLSLSTNSAYSQVVSLNNEQTKPQGWDDHTVPTVSHPEKTIVYEAHIRDFSAQDTTVSAQNRGKYLAFTEAESNPVQHLKSLQTAGLTHLHLLPTFDITTVNEDPTRTANINDTVETLCRINNDVALCANQNSFSLPQGLTLEDNQAVVFYKRDDANYNGWGLHLWNDENCNALADETLAGIEWETPLLSTGINTDFGAYYVLNTQNNTCINFIIHKGDEKALGEDNSRLDLSQGRIATTEHGSPMLTLREEGQAVADTRTLKEVLESYDPTTAQAQALMNDLRQIDSFNWGYDPYHFTVPEGSYASNANGITRIKEFRQMVKALHDMGLRVVLDVVYNHTSSSGLSNTSVLDKLVPGYYHRLNEISGAIERSSCCENTASEHTMMEKLMVDSLVVWARDYKIDSFRFDLMGHHMVRNMQAALEAVQAVDSDNYFYGEAWNFGEVIDSRRGINAIQKNVGGLGIGTFNDRLRDAVRGGGPFDSAGALRSNQGFGTGLYYYPNEQNSGSDTELAALNQRADWIRLSLAGNLASYALETSNGDVVLGANLDYQGQQAGYTQDPQENVNYISKHDNQTLWDNLQYKVAESLDSAARTRMQNFALSVPFFAQGTVFLHMGVDVLRSKSMQRDSFDSGDWFNRVDFTGQTHNWNIGLPREDKDGGNYAVITERLNDAQAKPTPENITLAKAVFKEWLNIRSTSPLFSLQTADQINTMVTFHNTGVDQVPGVIVMKITDTQNIDTQHRAVVVVFNASNTAQTMAMPNAQNYELHTVQQNSADTINQTSTATTNGLSVPALTTAVFVLPLENN